MNKLFIKNNKVETNEAAERICQVLSVSPKLTVIHLNFTGTEIIYNPGKDISLAITETGEVLAKVPTSRSNRIGS